MDRPSRYGTREILVAEFDGTMLFVSHDRHFLAALSNRVL
jgi:ATPase subunit of ABC transporter with duplicated ATPase domains